MNNLLSEIPQSQYCILFDIRIFNMSKFVYLPQTNNENLGKLPLSNNQKSLISINKIFYFNGVN